MSEDIQPLERVIAVEEHAWPPALRDALLRVGNDETVSAFSNSEHTNLSLLDVGDDRVARMDAMGVDFQVVSITTPGTQHLPPAEAVALARDANDWLAAAVARRPDRFAAFATLPTPDPEAAAEELRRAVTAHGCVGGMLFPRTGDLYLDHDSHRVIFAAAAELDVPLYIHPGLPPTATRKASYSGFGSMADLMLATGGWGWHAEAGLAALRLILAGTFDRHPGLQLILGHWGEMLVPFADRADALTRTVNLQRRILDYISENVYATAGGIFSHRMLRQVVDVVGPDRVMFAVDDPYRGTLGQRQSARTGEKFARDFIRSAPLSPENQAKFAHGNAEKLLRLRT